LIVPAAATPTSENLFENHGKVTMAKCNASAVINYTLIGRPAQSSTMLYHFLYASLMKEALTKINLRHETYTAFNNEDGLSFLRAIMTEAQLDTIGAVESFQKQLSHLPLKIMELSGNIKDFHPHVNTITSDLDSYCKEYPELILNLFDAYEKVEDKHFATYVMVTQFGYVAAPDTYQPRTLMSGVENLNKMRVQAGTWQPEKHQVSKIATLMAKIKALEEERDKQKGKGKMVQNKKSAWKFVVQKKENQKMKM
jgi:hypothetical protein